VQRKSIRCSKGLPQLRGCWQGEQAAWGHGTLALRVGQAVLHSSSSSSWTERQVPWLEVQHPVPQPLLCSTALPHPCPCAIFCFLLEQSHSRQAFVFRFLHAWSSAAVLLHSRSNEYEKHRCPLGFPIAVRQDLSKSRTMCSPETHSTLQHWGPCWWHW